MSTQHTPTPHLGNGIASAGHWFIADEGGARGIKREIFDEFGEHAGYELLCGDTDEIVNSHDALVAVLEDCHRALGGTHIQGLPSRIRAAIKAATEQQS